jgi:hypothetical protein
VVLLLLCRFALAEVHTSDLASKAELLQHMRPQLSNMMQQVLADKADALAGKADTLADKSDVLANKTDVLAGKTAVIAGKADAVLAGCQRLMALLPQHRPVPMLEGIGARR